LMVCFDTAILIWGVQGVSRPNQVGMIERTRRYIEVLREEKTRIMVPSPAVGEYLLGFETEAERRRQAELFQQHFIVPGLDLQAAALAADLERDAAGDLRGVEVPERQRLRVDAQILAIAIVNGATVVISHDAHMSLLAGGRILVREVPNVGKQLNLI
jgi:predicted nucleic acid-binding protein